MNNNKNIIHPLFKGLVIALCILSLSSCKIYERVDLVPVTDEPWQEILASLDPTREKVILVKPEGMPSKLHNYVIDGKNLSGEAFPLSKKKFYPSRNEVNRVSVPSELKKTFDNAIIIETDKDIPFSEYSINYDDVQVLRRYEIDKGKSAVASTIATILIGGTAVVGVGIIILLATCNCPKVYTIDNQGNKVLQGFLFTGAISPSLERTDLLPLKNLDRSKDRITINVANELPEDEFINELRLLKVPRKNGSHLGVDENGELFEYQGKIAPKSAYSTEKIDVLDKILNEDEDFYGFDEEGVQGELNSMEISFDRREIQGNTAKLVIYGNQTEWLEQVAESFFSLHGNEFDKINKRLDKAPRKMYEARQSKRGVSMNAYIMTKNGWSKAGTFHYAGVDIKKRMGLDIDLSKVEGDEVKIKLEAAYKFWELDQVSLSQDWKVLEKYEEVPLLSAINERGENVIPAIEAIDEKYARQPGEGSQITLEFENSADESEAYILRGTGYYRHMRDYEHPAQKEALKLLKSRGKLAAHELSQALFELQKTATAGN